MRTLFWQFITPVLALLIAVAIGALLGEADIGLLLGTAVALVLVARLARSASRRLRRLEQTDLNFVRLDMIRIDSARFREHVTALSTQNADYENFLTFAQKVRDG